METADIPKNFNTPAWVPTTDPGELRALGKALEEVGELTSALARSVIQGLDGLEPTTGKPNRQWLLEETADVFAALEIVIQDAQLDREALYARMKRKTQLLTIWRDRLRGAPA